MNKILTVLLAGALVSIAGCRRSGPDLMEVDGTVTLGGKPLEGGNILFSAIEGSSPCLSGALIQAGGRYTVPRDHGLLPGKYLVRIRSADFTKMESAGPPGSQGGALLPKEIVPEKYNKKSTLTVEVKPGMDSLDFHLE